MDDGRSSEAIQQFLLETVVAPCVKQLCEQHGADAVGEVVPGRETNAAAWYGQSTRDRSELEQLWARIGLTNEETTVALPLGNASMSFDEVTVQVEWLYDCIDAWYAQSGTGWGQQIEIEWSPDLTRAGWDRAVSLARGGTEGCDPSARDRSWPFAASGWVPAWNDSRSAFAEHQSRLSEFIGRRLVSAWVPIDRSDQWVRDLPVVVVGDDGTQLEICWTTGDKLSLTWNTVDLDASRHDDSVKWDDDMATFDVALTGGTITDIALVNFPAPRRRYIPGGDPFGLAIVAGHSAVTIYSGFDGSAADYEMSWLSGLQEKFEWVSVTSPPA